MNAMLTPERLSMASRVLAASIGAYVLVNMLTMALNFLLPWERYKSLLFAMQVSFVFYTLIIIWVFSVRTARKAWLGMLALGVPVLCIDLFFYFTELRA